jgi:hypothetical protein
LSADINGADRDGVDWLRANPESEKIATATSRTREFVNILFSFILPNGRSMGASTQSGRWGRLPAVNHWMQMNVPPYPGVDLLNQRFTTKLAENL